MKGILKSMLVATLLFSQVPVVEAHPLNVPFAKVAKEIVYNVKTKASSAFSRFLKAVNQPITVKHAAIIGAVGVSIGLLIKAYKYHKFVQAEQRARDWETVLSEAKRLRDQIREQRARQAERERIEREEQIRQEKLHKEWVEQQAREQRERYAREQRDRYAREQQAQEQQARELQEARYKRLPGDVKTAVRSNLNLYEILGVAYNASLYDIKKAYRSLAMLHHPDKGGDPEKFKDLTFANTILQDPEQRKAYDDWQYAKSHQSPLARR